MCWNFRGNASGFHQEGQGPTTEQVFVWTAPESKELLPTSEVAVGLIGFESKHDVDPCLFVSDKVICLVYCDDTLLYAKDKADIDDVINKLQDPNGCNMTLEIEDSVSGFLGVHIHRDQATGTITLTQTGLAKKIVDALDIQGLDPVSTPALEVLVSDKDGEPPNGVYSYASVCRMMLLYLSGHSQPVSARSAILRTAQNDLTGRRWNGSAGTSRAQWTKV